MSPQHPMHNKGAFQFLKPEVQKKAFEIADCLLAAGIKETVVETIAISNAKLWMITSTNSKKNTHIHIVPHSEGWALISEDASHVHFVCSSKQDALNKARSYAKNEKLKLYIHSSIGNIHDTESFVVNVPEENFIEARKQQKNVPVISAKAKEVSKTSSRGSSRWLARKIHSKLINTAEGNKDSIMSLEG